MDESVQCLHELFEIQADLTPHATALVDRRQSYSYRQLDLFANRIASHLVQLGVGPEQFVGICLDQSVEMVAGLLGVLKAGGAYLAIDPHFPRERVEFALKDLDIDVVVTQSSLSSLVPPGVRPVVLDEQGSALHYESTHRSASVATAKNLAYAIYTSGSSGIPKAVGIEHQSAVSLICCALRLYAPHELAGVVACTSACFDCTLFEVFVPLSAGGTALLATHPLELTEMSRHNEVTLISGAPSVIQALLLSGFPRTVCTVNLSGENVQQPLIDQLRSTPVQRILNLYGTSEATTYSTYSELRNAKELTIGRPLGNTTIFILNDQLDPVREGVVGELYIGGDALGRGYINRPSLTADRFIPDSLSGREGARLYRTGDLAKYLPDGEIVFMGRSDQQVKLRGLRIEPGEIEAALVQHPAIRQAVVVCGEECASKQLIAYCVSACPIEKDELTQFLKQRLPSYLVPVDIIFRDNLPLTMNGKVDRRALSASWGRKTVDTLRQVEWKPSDYVEASLREIWELVLPSQKFGGHESFFDLGGDSLSSLVVISKIHQRLGVHLSPDAVLRNPTIGALAAAVREQGMPRQQSCLVKVRSGSVGTAVVCVHAAPGDVGFLSTLANRVDLGRPIYGLQSVGLDGLEPPLRSISGMARRYVKELRLSQPQGPYFLLGNCMGGLVAYEMAHLLLASGECVGFLGLLDTAILDFETCLYATQYHSKANMEERDPEASIALRLEGLTRRYQALGLEWLVDDNSRTQQYLRRLAEVFVRNAYAGLSYQPKEFPGIVTLFRATQSARDQPHFHITESLQDQWRPLARDGLRVFDVPATHDELGEAPELGQMLRSCLWQADLEVHHV